MSRNSSQLHEHYFNLASNLANGKMEKLIMLHQGFFRNPWFHFATPHLILQKERRVVAPQGLLPCPTQVGEMPHSVSGKVTAVVPRPNSFLLPYKNSGC